MFWRSLIILLLLSKKPFSFLLSSSSNFSSQLTLIKESLHKKNVYMEKSIIKHLHVIIRLIYSLIKALFLLLHMLNRATKGNLAKIILQLNINNCKQGCIKLFDGEANYFLNYLKPNALS